MKNITIRKYITRILLFTVVYIAFLVIMDNVFNGIVLDLLFVHLPYNLYYMVNHNRYSTVLLVYIFGILIISIVYVFKLSRMLNMATRAINEENSKIFTNTCPDELREFSRKLKDFKYEIKANEQARMAAEQQKNDLVVYLAHDLKTPLTSVIGYLSLLEEANDMPIEQRARYTGIALDKAYRLEQLINEFFDITRLNLQNIPDNKTRINLTILLIQIINEFYPMFEEKSIKVVQNISPEIIISADADKIARVFDNLFRNAVNYSYQGSNIICTAYKNNGYVNISIVNQGDTIPQAKLNRIFDKFYRLDDSRGSSTGGAGLGLAIAKQIVELHNGTIEATSADNIVEFTVKLPM